MCITFSIFLCLLGITATANAAPLPGTQPLEMTGDIASNLVAGVDRFLLQQIETVRDHRSNFWHRNFTSPQAYDDSIKTNRQRLAHILGLRDSRPPFHSPTLVSTLTESSEVGRGPGYRIHQIRWPAFGSVQGEGLLLIPDHSWRGSAVVIPDADQLPEDLAGLNDRLPADQQAARRLAGNGFRVVVPVLIDRGFGPHKGKARMSAREFLYRPAFELGRHLIGYELQKVLALVDWFEKSADSSSGGSEKLPVVVMGWGEGGMLALQAGALDPRIDVTVVSGYFDQREKVWQEPIDRNVFGLLEQFGDAELAAMIYPRTLIVEAGSGPEKVLSGAGGGAPAQLTVPVMASVEKEFQRARQILKTASVPPPLFLTRSSEPLAGAETWIQLSKACGATAEWKQASDKPALSRPRPDPSARQARQFQEIDRHTQELLVESPFVRKEFWKRADTSSLEKFSRSIEEYRSYFADEVVGRFSQPLLAPEPRSRVAYQKEKWIGHEVVLEVFPEVIAYGVLLVPRDLKEGEKRPVVVCQHGLEGRPRDVIEGNLEAYHDFAARLADEGYITFAPQNLYLFRDRFRTLQRKANPLKKTLFSIIVPQHQQIVNWLSTLPFVDSKQIAFYGLSYGGKTAMRVPPLVTNYCLSICSADFNDWVWKNASSRSPYSYVWTGEYEIFEFDLGSTFNYAEMAALIAPRPFMVERGHFDGVAPDEAVASEFAKVRFLYQGRLGIGDRCEMETFAGPHTINGQGTFNFLKKHLRK